jgi:hypothetical protein
MLPAVVLPVLAPPLAVSDMWFEIGLIMGIAIAVVVCAAIPLTTGMTKGHVALGIIGALITVPVAAMLGCIGGLPLALAISFVIGLIPVPKKPLLSQAEIEREMRRVRGY